MSYSLYLLHPIIWAFFEKLFRYLKLDFPVWMNMIICIPCSLIASFVVYNSFEKYFMKLGKNFSMNGALGVKAG
jgi:peptidoglycan/LPS O-acetylase OafA/YrhL